MSTYKKSGVNIELSDKFTKFLEKKSKAIGGFAGILNLKESGNTHSIVASTDGVGTKLKLAFMLNKHDTIGIDLVAMCVNDILVCGARPLLFLDYYAVGKLELKKSKQVMKGILEGCKRAESILLGGETAEMPGFYKDGEYDLAGFSVGIVENSDIIDGSNIKAGDILIGLKSSGFHSNGFSLIRKALEKGTLLKKYASKLLTPTKIYVKDIKKLKTALKKTGGVLGLAHITGGGIEGNLIRILPKNMQALVYKKKWKVPTVMTEVQKLGKVPEKEMWKTFNMGIGMIAIVRKENAALAVKTLKDAIIIGEIKKGKKSVILK
jgi:phosphoribosylformylglycinamidine cyclo-ligase